MARYALAFAAASLGFVQVTIGQPLPWNARILPSYAPSCAVLDAEGRAIPDKTLLLRELSRVHN